MIQPSDGWTKWISRGSVRSIARTPAASANKDDDVIDAEFEVKKKFGIRILQPPARPGDTTLLPPVARRKMMTT